MTTTPTSWRGAARVDSTDIVGMAGTQSGAEVVGLAGNGFVVAWGDDTDRTGPGSRDIVGQRYDAGSGAGAAVQFATLHTKVPISHADLIVV